MTKGKSAAKGKNAKEEQYLEYCLKAEEYLYEEKYELAIKFYTKAIESSAEKAVDERYWNHYLRGRVYDKSANYDASIEDFTKAITLMKAMDPDADVGKFYLRRGCVYCKKGDKANAIKDAKEAMKFSMSNERAKELKNFIAGKIPRPSYLEKGIIKHGFNIEYDVPCLCHKDNLTELGFFPLFFIGRRLDKPHKKISGTTALIKIFKGKKLDFSLKVKAKYVNDYIKWAKSVGGDE